MTGDLLINIKRTIGIIIERSVGFNVPVNVKNYPCRTLVRGNLEYCSSIIMVS